MTKKNGLVTCKCDIREDGAEILNSTQRNNEIIWPSKDKYPNSQYTASWKNTCNVTSMIMALEYAGWIFPQGQYKQPEDNLAKFILESNEIDKAYMAGQPAMWKTYRRALNGQCSKQELINVYSPLELHAYLSKGTNLWLGSEATQFNTNVNFIKALWRYFVFDNLPMVISTNFGGFGHIVTCVGVTWTESDYNKGLEFYKENKAWPEIIPESIIVDDPWGNCSKSKFKSYPVGGGGSGNNIEVPWNIVVEHVKPLNSQSNKWIHSFRHGMPTV